MKSTYVCTKCGAFFTESVAADEGTAPCSDCGSKLILVAQTKDGVVTIEQVNNALGK